MCQIVPFPQGIDPLDTATMVELYKRSVPNSFQSSSHWESFYEDAFLRPTIH
jgi:hypothetical protein